MTSAEIAAAPMRIVKMDSVELGCRRSPSDLREDIEELPSAAHIDLG